MTYPLHPCRACGQPCVPGAGAPRSVRDQCQRCGVSVPVEGPIRWGAAPPRPWPVAGGPVPLADLFDPGPVRSRSAHTGAQ